jgi:SSS family solute:Na+ symporter
MTTRVLGSIQVAVLLISASYGIGFLFGSGEMALSMGMAGGTYGVATAMGMLALAVFAKRLWRSGVPVWDLFGRAYGARLQAAVAMLSMIWMAGVLAAQIHGGAAVIGLLGMSSPWHYAMVCVLIYAASRLDLRLASRVFAVCLLASGLVLAYALLVSDGFGVYAAALPLFVHDLSMLAPGRVVSTMLAVGVLVCLGADYHQFVFAARQPSAAVWGCVLAGLGLLLIAFLPPAVIVAMQRAGELEAVGDAKQVVPFVLARVAAAVGPGADKVMLASLVAAALGSGAAIVRAMTSALSSVAPQRGTRSHASLSLVAIAIGAALAARGQGIVETMVSVNVIYIASVAVVFAALMGNMALSPRCAGQIMSAGFLGSFAAYVAGWAGLLGDQADLMSLLSGLGASAAVAAVYAVISGTRPQDLGATNR